MRKEKEEEKEKKTCLTRWICLQETSYDIYNYYYGTYQCLQVLRNVAWQASTIFDKFVYCMPSRLPRQDFSSKRRLSLHDILIVRAPFPKRSPFKHIGKRASANTTDNTTYTFFVSHDTKPLSTFILPYDI